MDINQLCPGCMQEVQDREGKIFCPHCGYKLSEIQNAVHQLKPFTILYGKYIVGKAIGEGGFGITYLGLDLNLEVPVAIKEFYPSGFATRDGEHTSMVTAHTGNNEKEFNRWRENFLKEARILAKLSKYEGIVAVRDYFVENSTVYIVMEYVEGITLKDYLQQKGGKINAEIVFKLFKPVMRALETVHKEGIIHRDISPDNIMITANGELKLLDFGAARSYSTDLEKSRSIAVKSGYAPEEQYRSKGEQGPWTDVYALCATMYKCITGQKPPEANERLREDKLQRPSVMGIAIQPFKEEIILQGLAVYAEKRIRSIAVLMKLLYQENEASAEKEAAPEQKQVSQTLPHGGRIDVPPVENENKGKPAKKGKWVAIAAILIIGVGIGGALFLQRDKIGELLAEKKPSAAQADIVEESTQDAAESLADGTDITTADEMVLDAEGKIEDSGTRAEAMQILTEAISIYKQLGTTAENAAQAQEGMSRAWELYCNAAIKQVDFLFEQDPQKVLYDEMVLELENTISYGDEIVQAGFDIDQSDILEERQGLDERYRRKYIETYNHFIEEYQWNVRYNEEMTKEAIELLPGEDDDDPLQLRYAYAYAWLVHQEVVEGIAGGEMQNQDAVYYIADALEKADYCEFLLEDAEAYAWNDQGNWVNWEYYAPVGYQPIIDDSSTREYTEEDIRRLGLNAAELRYARYEIYARHGMKTWDEAANQTLAQSNLTGNSIAREKFMSYNDFDVFSTDGVNGLTPTERNNIRSITKVAIEDGMMPWL